MPSFRTLLWGCWSLGCAWLCLLGTFAGGASAWGDETPPATHEVKRRPFKLEATLPGVVAAERAHEVAPRPKSWTQLQVVTAAPAGTQVKRGDVVVQLDLDKIDEAIREQEMALQQAKIALQRAQEQVKLLEESTPLDLELAQRALGIAQEDLDHFQKLDGPNTARQSEFQLKLREQYMEYQLEELKQLEKMYKADDLVEETEEIILKRARNSVEQAKFQLEVQRLAHDKTMQVELPRTLQRLRDTARATSLAWDKARLTLPLALNKERLELDKQMYDLRKAEQQLTRLQDDRRHLTLTAPADGVVYYGRAVRGKWPPLAEMAAKLRPGGTLAAHEVAFTVVEPGAVRVLATVAEKDLPHVAPGAAAQLTVVGLPDARLVGQVAARSPIPVAEGQFEAVISLRNAPRSLVAGMACEAKVVVHRQADALAVPAKVVFRDDLDDDARYVYLAPEKGPPQRRPVVVSHATADWVVIDKGLQPGDKVLLERPKDE